MKRRETLTLGNGTHTGAGESCEWAVTSLGGVRVASIMEFQGAGRPEKVIGVLKPGVRGSIVNETREPTLSPGTAATAKSLQSCLTLCDPIDSSPPGSPVPGILQARTLEWVAISFSNAQKWKVKGKLLSRVQLFATPWTVAHQAPPSMGFARQEYWGGVPLPSPGTSSSQSRANVGLEHSRPLWELLPVYFSSRLWPYCLYLNRT